ncbi:hypothetical protein PHAVU_002G302704 [Phaseolus vulgaris]
MNSGRPSIDDMDSGMNPRLSTGSDFDNRSYGSSCSGAKSDEVEAEMSRLMLELKQTMEMYSTAFEEAVTAKKKALELEGLKVEEQRKLEAAKTAHKIAVLEAQKAMANGSLDDCLFRRGNKRALPRQQSLL